MDNMDFTERKGPVFQYSFCQVPALTPDMT